MENHQTVFRAIADPTRRAIIGLLSEQDMPLNTIVSHFDISRPAVAKHVKILREGGLVDMCVEGREHWHSLRPEGLKSVADWVDTYSRFWDVRLDTLKTIIEEGKT